MTAVGWAQHPGPYFHADLGIGLIQDINATVDGTPGKLKFDPGVRASLGIGYLLYSSSAIETAVQFETGVIYNPARRLSSDFFDSRVEGELYQVPFLADIVYTFNLSPRLAPYLGIGGGGVYSRITIDSIDDFPVGTTSDEFDPAVQALAGLRFRLDDRNEIGVGYKFLATFAKDNDYIGTHSLSLTYLLRF